MFDYIKLTENYTKVSKDCKNGKILIDVANIIAVSDGASFGCNSAVIKLRTLTVKGKQVAVNIPVCETLEQIEKMLEK